MLCCYNMMSYCVSCPLLSAVLQELTPADFDEYCSFHNRKLFAAPYAPQLFCHAVRASPTHSRQGVIGFEASFDSGSAPATVAMRVRG